MTEIDQAFFLRAEVKRLDTLVRRQVLLAVFAVLWAIIMAAFFQTRWVGVASGLIGIVFGLRACYFNACYQRAVRVCGDFVSDHLYYKLSHERQARARAGGAGHYFENILAEYECQDAHLPGDCPLCGAT